MPTMHAVLALAHAGAPPAPHELWRAWSHEPAVVLSLAAGAALHARGVDALRRHARSTRGLPPWRVHCFAAGMLTLAIALLSPLHALGEALFAGHMLQHLLLTMVAAPLLVLGDPRTAWLWGVGRDARRRLAGAWRRLPRVRAAWRDATRVLTHAVTAWTVQAAVLVAWHLPPLYERAVRDDVVHALEHATLLLSAFVAWSVLFSPRPRTRLGAGTALLFLFTTSLVTTLLGAAITLSTRPWYRVHARSALAWGTTALEDQQLAGLVMWVPASAVHLAAALVLLHALLVRRPLAPARR